MAQYYVATTGDDSNPGTLASPFKTWQKGFFTVAAGDTLFIRGGVYTDMLGLYSGSYFGVRVSSHDGTALNLINVQAYTGETPILDCSSLAAYAGTHYGILLTNCDYWNIKGLLVRNVNEYTPNKLLYSGTAWEISDGTNITLDQCVVTTSMNGFTVSGTVTNLRYVNCDAHHCYDYYDTGGLANGFGGNMAAGSTISYDGCRAWSNSDDGWDCFAGHGYITFNNCWAWRNGKDVPTIGNGDGFKVGPPVPNVEESGIQRTLTNCLSWDNKLMGFDESMDVTSSMDMALYNCIAYSNGDYGFRFSAAPGTGVTTLRNNISYLNAVNYEGRARNITDHNTWSPSAPAISNADFVSVDSTGVDGARGENGELPVLDFLKLVSDSDMIDAGVDVGLPFEGVAPDLGAYEYVASAPPLPDILISNPFWHGFSNNTALDIDDNLYNTVVIGNQEWMVENLKTTHYADGTSIPNLTVDADWLAEDGTVGHDGAYCAYNNDLLNVPDYGLLYNSFTVDNSHGLAPSGWRVPSRDDFDILRNFIGDLPGVKLKEIGTAHWLDHANIGTDLYGFKAVGTGQRTTGASFYVIKQAGYLLASNNLGTKYIEVLSYDQSNFFETGVPYPQFGYPVRCVRDI
ncbi:MAG: hypothetical protein IMZ64_12030 [Bacteroidetes bacterium]|nr:hypothetical protein [Bacteroidota bacterium]